MLINRIVGITCNKEAQRIALSFITAVSYQISLIMFPTSLLHVVKMSTIFFLIYVFILSHPVTRQCACTQHNENIGVRGLTRGLATPR